MPTQKGGYFVQDGTKVPSVTTIISRFKESGGLIHWAWKLGTEGKDYRKERDDAASAGTLAHAMVEGWVKSEYVDLGPYDTETIEKAKRAFSAFKEWADQTQLKVTHSEVALVSEKYRFGGTLDCMLVNNKRSLGDVKTSNSIYHDYLMQLAAYGILWDENYPDEPIEGGYHIMRFSKDDGDFEHRWFGDLSDAREMFIHLRAAYDYDQKLKKRIR